MGFVAIFEYFSLDVRQDRLASGFSCFQAESTPAPAPVPITAVVKDPKIIDFSECQVESIRAVKEKNSHDSFFGTIYS